ncbi:class A beta-lactamase [Kineococcus sp. SYSU DK006]|uniref:class A beta-lactamase n=1 Tax=Kineococcus sp. SYSU DK006 TaxID=3383127 RepID=UPI003D7E51C2
MAGCGATTSAGSGATSPSTSTAPGSPGGPGSPGSPGSPRAGAASPTVDSAAQAQLAQLETRFDARLGLFAIDTATGRTVAHRAQERFGFASTCKAFAAAAVLAETTDAELDAVVTWSVEDVVAHSPVTEQHTGSGLPLREVAESAITVSDNTAANLLVERLGGPAGLEQDLRALGDASTEVENDEPEVNDIVPGDPADTSTPEAMARTLQAYAVGDVLESGDREQFVQWLRANTTGDEQVRAGVPDGWVVGDKTGHAGVHGNQNDIAVVWPAGGRAPRVLAVPTDRADVDADSDNALLAAATRVVVQHLG